MKTVSLTRVLEYYDLPLVFEGEDEGGQRYICDSLFTTQEGGEVFLAVAVTDSQIEKLNRGDLCLRSALLSAGEDGWYRSAPQWDFTKPFTLEPAAGPISACPNLPQEGYMLDGAWDD